MKPLDMKVPEAGNRNKLPKYVCSKVIENHEHRSSSSTKRFSYEI